MTERGGLECHPCVAHRGWSGKAPENTLAAFRMALAEPSVQWIELDVRLSKDGVPVVIHDPTLNRTTDGKGRVADRTARELARLDAGGWFHPSFAGEPVPTLEEVLALAAGRCRLNIELKTDETERDGIERLARATADVLRTARLTDEVVVTSSDPVCLGDLRWHAPELRLGLVAKRYVPGLAGILRKMGVSFLSLYYRRLNPAALAECARHGVDVMAWTVNRLRDLVRLVAMPEPFLVCPNHPDRWFAVVRGPAEAGDRPLAEQSAS